MNFPWNLAHFKKSTMKLCIFSRELGWSLMVILVMLHPQSTIHREPVQLLSVRRFQHLCAFIMMLAAVLILTVTLTRPHNQRHRMFHNWWRDGHTGNIAPAEHHTPRTCTVTNCQMFQHLYHYMSCVPLLGCLQQYWSWQSCPCFVCNWHNYLCCSCFQCM